jgi:hypothetical protein
MPSVRARPSSTMAGIGLALMLLVLLAERRAALRA